MEMFQLSLRPFASVMRFRAEISDPQTLERSVLALLKLGSKNECTLVISSSSWSFRVTDGASTGLAAGACQAFLEVDAETAFHNYRIESVHENTICMGTSLSNISRALKSAANAQKVTVSLTKKNSNDTPSKSHSTFLTFKINHSGHSAHLIQDVPITILPFSRMEETSLPDLAEPSVKFRLPQLKALKVCVDRMKNLSDALNIVILEGRKLALRIETDDVNMGTTFSNVHMSDEGEGGCWVDIRHFAKSVAGNQIHSSVGGIGCIIEDVCFVLHCQVEEFGELDYLIPLRME